MDADASARTRRRILLLEQDEYLASLLDMLLHREGFEIVALTSDDHARQVIHGMTPPDLIFIDCLDHLQNRGRRYHPSVDGCD